MLICKARKDNVFSQIPLEIIHHISKFCDDSLIIALTNEIGSSNDIRLAHFEAMLKRYHLSNEHKEIFFNFKNEAINCINTTRTINFYHSPRYASLYDSQAMEMITYLNDTENVKEQLVGVFRLRRGLRSGWHVKLLATIDLLLLSALDKLCAKQQVTHRNDLK
jgi:hypothetical protein